MFENNVGPDGCAIFYRLSEFQIINMSCEKIMINEEICSQVFIIITLKHTKTKKNVTIVCLHLKSKAKNHERRERQIQFVLNSLKIHLSGSTYASEPILLCGDFNGEPFENFCKLIVNDKDLTNLVDSYSLVSKGKKEPTTIKIRDSKMLRRGIDYVFYNKNALKLNGYLELPKNDELIEEQGLPNLKYSSDHLSLVCDFTFS